MKHGNPCGVATGRTPEEAFARAREADPVSIFGGIVGFNAEVNIEVARLMSDMFLEAVIAPGYEAGALEILESKKNLRILKTSGVAKRVPAGMDLRRVEGGLLVQTWDSLGVDPAKAKVVTKKRPTTAQIEALRLAWITVRHVRSNAIVYASHERTLGIGAGQMSRVDSVRFGAMKATGPLKGSVMASDAFFPFRDSIDEAARSGVAAIIQPGGSVKDAEVIAAADEHGIAMLFTAERHFRH